MMKKTITFIFLSLFAVITVNAQQEEEKADSKKWNYSFKPGVTYSSTSFQNWFKGGNELVTMKLSSLGNLNYESDRFIWKNTLFMDYGFTKKRGQKVQVNVDKLDFSSRLSLINSEQSFKYTALFGIKSQFTDGYNYLSSTQWLLQSSFFAPGYITLNFGVDYMKVKNLVIHLSPISEKTTIVREAFYDKKVINEYWGGYEPEFMPEDDHHTPYEQTPTEEELEPYETVLSTTYVDYGLAWRENARFEVGSNIQFLYDNQELFKFLGLKSRLDIFASYTQLSKPDIDWETWLSINFNNYIAFNINFHLAYDYDIKFQEYYEEPDGTPGVRNVPKLQLRNFLGFGVSYTFK
jgi:hypothetical protein